MISIKKDKDKIIYSYINTKGKVKQLKLDINDEFNDEFNKLNNDEDKINALSLYYKPTKGNKIRILKLKKEEGKTEQENKNKEYLDDMFEIDKQLKDLNRILVYLENENELTEEDKNILNKMNVNENKEDIKNKINELSTKKEEIEKKIYKLKDIDLKKYVNNQIKLLDKNYSYLTYQILNTLKKDKDVKDTVEKITETNGTVKDLMKNLPDKYKKIVADLIKNGIIEKNYKNIINILKKIYNILNLFQNYFNIKDIEKYNLNDIKDYNLYTLLNIIDNYNILLENLNEKIIDVVNTAKQNGQVLLLKKESSKGKETFYKLNNANKNIKLKENNYSVNDFQNVYMLYSYYDNFENIEDVLNYIAPLPRIGKIIFAIKILNKICFIQTSSKSSINIGFKSGVNVISLTRNNYVYIRDNLLSDIETLKIEYRDINETIKLLNKDYIEKYKKDYDERLNNIYTRIINKLMNDNKIKDINDLENLNKKEYYELLIKLIDKYYEDSDKKLIYKDIMKILMGIKIEDINEDVKNNIFNLFSNEEYKKLKDEIKNELFDFKTENDDTSEDKINEIEYIEEEDKNKIIKHINKMKGIINEYNMNNIDKDKAIRKLNKLIKKYKDKNVFDNITDYIIEFYSKKLNDFDLSENDIKNITGEMIVKDKEKFIKLFEYIDDNKLPKNEMYVDIPLEGRKLRINEKKEVEKILPEKQKKEEKSELSSITEISEFNPTENENINDITTETTNETTNETTTEKEPIKPPNKGLTLSDIAGRLDRIEGIIKDSLRIKPKNNDIIYQLQHFYD
jgi:hypothetical protein